MRKILIQLDGDEQASSFDSITAIDAGVDFLLPYSQVTAEQVQGLVHGSMFTRGPESLKHTAIFVGGADVAAAEQLLTAVRESFFGPVRVSVMLDANGCNTTAAAAVVCMANEMELSGAQVVVMGTGPVGRRVCKLLALGGAKVVVTSRSQASAEKVAAEINEALNIDSVRGVKADDQEAKSKVLHAADGVIACGAAGVELINQELLTSSKQLKVAIDLNAVPPTGIAGIDVGNRAKMVGDVCTYGAVGIGGLKMKTHRAAVEALFRSNDRILNEEEIFEIAKSVHALRV